MKKHPSSGEAFIAFAFDPLQYTFSKGRESRKIIEHLSPPLLFRGGLFYL